MEALTFMPDGERDGAYAQHGIRQIEQELARAAQNDHFIPELRMEAVARTARIPELDPRESTLSFAAGHSATRNIIQAPPESFLG